MTDIDEVGSDRPRTEPLRGTVKDDLTPDSPAAERLPEIVRRLRMAHPDARCALDHRNPLELLVATILSAQSTDEQVNKITPALFEKYPTAADFAAADRSELEEAVHSTGFYRRKAGYLQAACEILVREHDGQVPADMDALVELPGVARKTANVVLGVAFGIADGVVVDTHVKRLAQRLALTDESNPDKIEADLMQLVPQEEWIDIAHLLIFHGRRICDARRPECAICSLNDLCPAADFVAADASGSP